MRNSSLDSRVVARRRMLDAALEIVARGGYDSLQVRAVAERARVSSRTIYENFPSLDSLLIAAVAERSEAFYHRYTRIPPRGRTPGERVSQLIFELTDAMAANQVLTVALLRALLSGKPGIGHHVHRFRDDLRAVLASAISGGGGAGPDREVAEMLESIWFAALTGWASGIDSDIHINEIMRSATRLLLPNDDPEDFGKQGFISVESG